MGKAKSDKKFDKYGHCGPSEGRRIQISVRCVEVCTLRELFRTTERNKDAPQILPVPLGTHQEIQWNRKEPKSTIIRPFSQFLQRGGVLTFCFINLYYFQRHSKHLLIAKTPSRCIYYKATNRQNPFPVRLHRKGVLKICKSRKYGEKGF